jgi:hypothetical protein
LRGRSGAKDGYAAMIVKVSDSIRLLARILFGINFGGKDCPSQLGDQQTLVISTVSAGNSGVNSVVGRCGYCGHRLASTRSDWFQARTIY